MLGSALLGCLYFAVTLRDRGALIPLGLMAAVFAVLTFGCKAIRFERGKPEGLRWWGLRLPFMASIPLWSKSFPADRFEEVVYDSGPTESKTFYNLSFRGPGDRIMWLAEYWSVFTARREGERAARTLGLPLCDATSEPDKRRNSKNPFASASCAPARGSRSPSGRSASKALSKSRPMAYPWISRLPA
ncbi:hypothetical protein ACFL2T_00965 [Elusimicrobiota bacterium]